MSDERPPGWYPDPFGTRDEDRRYWDGDTWLASTPPPTPEPAMTAAPASEPQAWQQRPDEWQAQPWMHEGLPKDRVVTPDGVRLATWGRRLGGYVIDAILLGLVSLLIAWPTGVIEAFSALADDLGGATTQAQLDELQTAFLVANAGTIALLSILSTVTSAVYGIGMVATRGATLGKMAVGIGVRLRDREGLPGWRAATVRWLVQFGPGLLSSVQVVSYLATIFQVVDGLWPIWDPRRQAIHDKAARTNVVVRRG